VELNLLGLSIGIGLVVSLLFSELFGLAAGGLVVPGYFALYLTRPIDVGASLAAALLTFSLVRIASTFIIVYGRRRTALMILVGYVVGVLMTAALDSLLEALTDPTVLQVAQIPTEPTAYQALRPAVESFDAGVIGYIVPGLIAIWLDRQGVVPTLTALFTSAVVVRLILILAVPEELQWFHTSQPLPPAIEEFVTP